MDTTLDLYKFYFTDLKNLSEGYISFEITMSLTIITIIGWFLTSEKAQKVVTSRKYIVNVFCGAVVLTALAELFIVCRLKNMSDKICLLVKSLADRLDPPLGSEYYAYRVIGGNTVIVF